MNVNVTINVRDRGKLITSREGHNVWVDRGRQYLAEIVGYSDPDVPTAERSDRPRYVGFGVGSVNQTQPDVADVAPYSVSYPAGEDPNATNGHEYRKSYPIDPLITTLERPVRITGGTNPYGSASPSDVWLVDDPDIFCTHMSLYELTVHALVDCGAGQLVYAPFDPMPLSEVGLFTDEGGPMGPVVSKNIPYSPLVGYFSFDTIMLDSNNLVEVAWRVRFA